MGLTSLNQIAVPGVYLLILFLGYPSQVLFYYLDPAPLTKKELYISNVVLVLIFVTYTRSVFVDPGTLPKSYGKDDKKEHEISGEKRGDGVKRTKWCRRCDAAKPPRAHHCKECKRYLLFLSFILLLNNMPYFSHVIPFVTNIFHKLSDEHLLTVPQMYP
jgi:hypothetical protein